MAATPEIPLEVATAGDPYALVHIAESRAYSGTDVWAAQVRKNRSDADALASFTVVARAGTTADAATGGDETGNTVTTLSLTGTQTRALAGKTAWCDLQVTPSGSDPTTFLRWRLSVEQDVTR